MESAQGVWRAGFQGENSGVTINYDPVGSGTGRENFISGAFSFAGSDSALSTDEGELDAANERCGGDVIEVPAYVSPIAVVYNLPASRGSSSTQRRSPRSSTARSRSGTTRPSPTRTPTSTSGHRDHTGAPLGRLRHDQQLHRLPLAGHDGNWSYEADGVWPIQGGEAAEGTSGVVAAVKAGEGTIAYADESQAGGLGIAAIKVGEEYTAPSAEGAAKVVAVSPRSRAAVPATWPTRWTDSPPSQAPTR